MRENVTNVSEHSSSKKPENIRLNKGVYLKYVGGGGVAGVFYKFFKKYFVAQDTIDLNISWPSNFFRKYFIAPPINFSFLFMAYL